MRKDKIKFIKKSVLFVTIFTVLTSLILALPSYIFFISKEHFPLDRVIELQNNQEQLVLYGVAYSDESTLYKLKLVNSRHCDIISLGNSRVLQFRDHFFNRPFCNAGRGSYKLEDFQNFIKEINVDNKPQILIVGLDKNFFNAGWQDVRQNFAEENKIGIFLRNVFLIYKDYFAGKIDLQKIRFKDTHKIGLNAITNNNGYRNDGSYLYGEAVQKNEPYLDRVHTALAKIESKHSQNRYKYGHDFSAQSINQLRSFLAYSHDNNITIIAFFPPYAQEVWDKINEHQEDYAYMFKIYPEIKPLFEEYGFELYDFSDMKVLNASSCEIIDDIHASEKAYLRILIKMVESDSVLNDSVDVWFLREKLSNSPGCFSTPEEKVKVEIFEPTEQCLFQFFPNKNAGLSGSCSFSRSE